MDNTQKTLKNSFISVVAQIMTLLLQFINRKVFILFLDIEFLGYQTIFSNVFGLLSVAELGIGNIIAFHLYKEIWKLMSLYKWLYRIVAGIVCIAGLVCYFLLPFFVKDATVSWSYLHLIYFIQLSSVVFGYFLSYKRVIYIVTQQEYKCVQVDLYVNAFIQIAQLLLLAIFHNYILYLCLQLSITILANIIIAKKSQVDFPYLKKKYSITKSDIKKWNIYSDMKNFLVHQVSYAVFGATDNIIISAFCGVRSVALFGNYVLIQKGVMQILFYKLLNPVQATIGNIVYENRDKKKLWNQFKILDIFSFFFATFIGLGFFTFYQTFIELWMGKAYILPFSFVIVFSIYIYFGAVFEIVYKYRCVFGEYNQDKWYMVLSAVLNIIISILGAKHFGVTGVIFGTLIAFLPIAFGRSNFVVKNYFKKSVWRYLVKHFCLFIIVVIEAAIIYLSTVNIQPSIIGLFIRVIVWLLVPLFINTLVYYKNPQFKQLLGYLKRILKITTSKIKR